MRTRSVAILAWAFACTPPSAPTQPRSDLLSSVASAATAPSPAKPVETAKTIDAASIWNIASTGDIDGARRALAWFRAHPPVKRYASDDHEPEVACSTDGARCAFSVIYPGGTGVVDGSGRPLRMFPWGTGIPSSFAEGTHLLWLVDVPGPGRLVDVDTGQAVLELPRAGWSHVTYGEKFVTFGLDGPDSERTEPGGSDDVNEQRVGVWHIPSGRMLFEIQTELGSNPHPDLSSNDKFLLLTTDTRAFAWRLEDRSLVASGEHPEDVPGAIASDGNWVAVATYASNRSEVQLVDGAGKIVARSRACPKPRALEFSKSGKLLAVAGERHGCVLKVPSLSPVFTSPAIAKSRDDSGKLVACWFFGGDRLVAFRADGGEIGLFELTGSKRRHFARGWPREAPNGDVGLIDNQTRSLVVPRSLVVLRDLTEIARRPLTHQELVGNPPVAELGESEPPGAEVERRVMRDLCVVHGHVFPKPVCSAD